jgi:hypothetical protein
MTEKKLPRSIGAAMSSPEEAAGAISKADRLAAARERMANFKAKVNPSSKLVLAFASV